MSQESLELEFLENVIHDMKIPLSIMYAKIESLESNNKLTYEVHDSLNVIKNNWYRVMKFVNDISDYEKLNKGLISINYKNEDIVLLIKHIVDISKVLADKKNITFNFVSNMPKKIMATDKEVIERVLLNIISNAIKHTDMYGHILIKLDAYQENIFITIKDNGNGIMFDNIEVVFDRYVTSNKKSKNGIGLSIVKQFIDLLDGTITLKSDSNGTEIKIELPCFFSAIQNNDELKIEDFYKSNKFAIELADNYNF